MLSGLCKSCTYGRGFRKCDYPANTDNNVESSAGFRTNKVEERRKLNLYFFRTSIRIGAPSNP
jgi:hypothetical protein